MYIIIRQIVTLEFQKKTVKVNITGVIAAAAALLTNYRDKYSTFAS